MSLQVQSEKLENAQMRLTIEVPANDVKSGFDYAYQKIGSQIKMKGFRPGKVPRNILKKNYDMSIKMEAIERIVSKAIEKAVSQEEIKIISAPELDESHGILEKLEEGQDFSFKAKIELFPTVELGEYKGIKVSAPEFYYDESHVEEKLKELQERMADHTVKDSAVAEKDLVEIEYKFYLVAKEDENYETHQVNLAHKDYLFGEVQEQLIGMKVGDEKEIEMKIPDAYFMEQLRGKDGKAFIRIKQIKELKLPEIDDELAKDFNFDSLAALKQDITKNLEEMVKKKQNDAIFEKLIEEVINNSQFEIGPAVIENQVENQVEQFKGQLAQFQAQLEDYLARQGQSLEEFKNQFRESAERSIKYDLIRTAILEKEKIEVSDDDLNEQYQKYAEYAKVDFEEAKKRITTSQEYEAFLNSQLYQKVTDFLIKNADVTYTSKESILDHEQN